VYLSVREPGGPLRDVFGAAAEIRGRRFPARHVKFRGKPTKRGLFYDQARIGWVIFPINPKGSWMRGFERKREYSRQRGYMKSGLQTM